ncbi:MAG: hypothetical protein HKM95_02825 [Inquilinus sp.]|nr:hypothetical protein [Inquilinus sp.]
MPAWAESGNALYSIEVGAVRLDERVDALRTYLWLKDKGYLVYLHRAFAAGDGRPMLRVAVGAFTRRGAAAEFGRAFGAAEGLPHAVAPAPVEILPGADGREFVVTPSALWVRGVGGPRELHPFTEKPTHWDLHGANRVPNTMAAVSPRGDAVAFADESRLFVATLDGRPAVALTDRGAPGVGPDHTFPWRPRWSPDGQYIAFLEQAIWDSGPDFGPLPVGLWLARADGVGARCLTCDAGVADVVRWFAWHPGGDRLLFVGGSGLVARSVGGGLYGIGTDGTVRTLIAAPDPDAGWRTYEEIAGPLTVADGHLQFRRVRWLDEAFETQSVTGDRLPVDR